MGKPVVVSPQHLVSVATLERPDVQRVGDGLQGAARFAAGARRDDRF